MRGRQVETGVLDGRADPVPRLPHRGIRQAHGGERLVLLGDAREVDLNVDDVSVDPVNSSGAGFEEHAVCLLDR